MLDELSIDVRDHVAIVEVRRPPHNFFDLALIRQIGDAYDELADGDAARAIVLCSAGKNFCAGANFAAGRPDDSAFGEVYSEALRLFAAPLPVVAAVQGAAVGGGLGLACSADFRVASSDSSFHANFSRLGLHHGFGLSVTLPRIVGEQAAAELLLVGSRLDGGEAARRGLVDRLVSTSDVRGAAVGLATELAGAGPLAVRSIRATLRTGLVDQIAKATTVEATEQRRLAATSDFKEGVAATAARRTPAFTAT